MPSMKDVARLAGVSVATVSRVINKTVPVEEQTRTRVEEAITRLGYRPNLLGSGLRSRRGRLIGLAVPDIANPSFANFVRYTEEFARRHKCNLIVGNTADDPAAERRFIDQLLGRNVDGILFSRVSDESESLRMLDDVGTPFVVIDRGMQDERAASVVMDNERTGHLAARHLLSLGHREIVCVTGPLNVALCRQRLAGLRAALRESELDASEACFVEGNFKYGFGEEAVEHILTHRPETTAIWAQNDLMAIGVMNALQRRGIRIPEDVSVVGVDDIEFATMIRPQLTTVQQPFREMCRIAVEMLFEGNATGADFRRRVVISTQLVIRESTSHPRVDGEIPHSVAR